MLRILLLTIGIGLALGLVRRGSVKRLALLRIHGLPFAYVSFVVGLSPLVLKPSTRVAHILVSSSYVLILCLLLVNAKRHVQPIRRGFALLLIGWMLNFVPIALNGGMPLSRKAATAAGLQGPIASHRGGYFKVIEADNRSKAKWLGDVIPIAVIHQVVSIGDIILVLAIVTIISDAMIVSDGSRSVH